jgi:hypothetical protein
MFEASVAVVERDAAIESLIDLDFGPGEAEAATLPLHDIVVADGTFVYEAADAVEALWSIPPSGFHSARFTSKTAVVIGEESAQHGVGVIEVSGFGQPQFAGEAILQPTPKALDAAFGLLATMKVTPSCARARPNCVG